MLEREPVLPDGGGDQPVVAPERLRREGQLEPVLQEAVEHELPVFPLGRRGVRQSI